MAKKLFIPIFLSCLALSTGLQAQFARIYGGQNSDIPVELLPTADGGFIVFGDSNSFPGRAWLLKLAGDGSVLWEKAYAVDPSGAFRSGCATPDGGYLLAGGLSPNLWLIKTDGLGEAEWQRSIGNNPAVTYAVCPSVEPGYFVIGSTSAGGSNTDIWAMKISSAGDPVWEKAYGLPDTEAGTCAAPTADGGCVIGGVTTSSSQSRMIVLKIDSLGAVSWQKAFSIPDYTFIQAAAVRMIAGGGFILAGSLSGGGRADGFVINLDESGGLLGARSYGAGFRDIQAAQDGGWFVAGSIGASYTLTDILAMKLTADGDIDWQRSFGGPFKEDGAAVLATPDGGCILAGSTSSYGAGAEDICVVRLSPAGVLGTCRFSRDPALAASTPTVAETSLSLSVREMGSVVQAGSFGLSNTAGTSESYELCTTRKLLTLLSGLPNPPSFSPALGTHVYNDGASVTIEAPSTVPGSGGHYEFSNWEGDLPGHSSTFTFTITDDTVLKAQYTWKSEGGGGGDGGNQKSLCAMDEVYGSPASSAINLLHDFRDRRLIPNQVGRAFVTLYYRVSPSVARVISGSPGLRFAAKVVLLPVIAVAFIVLKLGWVPALLLAAGGLLSFRRVRRRLRAL